MAVHWDASESAKWRKENYHLSKLTGDAIARGQRCAQHRDGCNPPGSRTRARKAK